MLEKATKAVRQRVTSQQSILVHDNSNPDSAAVAKKKHQPNVRQQNSFRSFFKNNVPIVGVTLTLGKNAVQIMLLASNVKKRDTLTVYAVQHGLS